MSRPLRGDRQGRGLYFRDLQIAPLRCFSFPITGLHTYAVPGAIT